MGWKLNPFTKSLNYYKDIAFVSAPATMDAEGSIGQFASDDDYVYVCTAADTWVSIRRTQDIDGGLANTVYTANGFDGGNANG